MIRTDSWWTQLFAITLDSLWKAQNAHVFRLAPIHTNQVVGEIFGRVQLLANTSYVKSLSSPHQAYQIPQLGWVPPTTGAFKLNCDGVVSNINLASSGGVLRDSNESFIMGFVGMVGSCSVVQVKLWAIYLGLRIIKERIESDSAEAMKFLNEGCSRNHPCYSLVNLIVRTAADFHKLECNHVLREANQVADRFAKLYLFFVVLNNISGL
uniref:Ribonuclease H protein At1g65750 n=1 Tax=Cajanus cajan TaxID=3821 RepID=A0A151UA64_CAJCA|nr:Putative ribonuclease H protein At1g65750 [Cajanus cajan]